MTREEVAEIVRVARELVAAHERRDPEAARATLAEESAVFALSHKVTSTLNRYRSTQAA